MKSIYKIIRITAWLLVLVTIFTLFSGFLTTKYFLTPWLGYSSAYFIHTVVIPLIFLPIFYLHSLAGLLILISRHQVFNTKQVKIIAGVIWTSIFVLFIFFYLSQNPAAKTNAGNPAESTITPSQTTSVSLTLQEISKHNTAADCWMIISNKVYNLTSFLPVHPGGMGLILPYCGKDGTNAFDTKNSGTPHSSTANNILNSYYLGEVGQTISNQQIQNVQSPSQNIPGNIEGDRNND